MTRFRVEVVEPTSLLSGSEDPRAAFERVWELIPHDDPRRLWRFLESDGGLFVKGLALPARPTLAGRLQSRRLVAEQRRLRELVARGLPFPVVVAWGVERAFLAARRSFLVLKVLPDVVDLEQYLLTGEAVDEGLEDKVARAKQAARESRRRRREPAARDVTPEERHARQLVLDAVGRAVHALHAVRAFHRDLSPRNVLLRFGEPGEAPSVHFIDCPRAALDPPALVASGMRRSELYRLTRGVRRTGASREECRVLLDAAVAPAPDTILDYVDLQAGSRRRPRRVSLWYVTGRAL